MCSQTESKFYFKMKINQKGGNTIQERVPPVLVTATNKNLKINVIYYIDQNLRTTEWSQQRTSPKSAMAMHVSDRKTRGERKLAKGIQPTILVPLYTLAYALQKIL